MTFLAPFGGLAGANRSMLILAEHLQHHADVRMVMLFDDQAAALAREKWIPVFCVFSSIEQRRGRWQTFRATTRLLAAQVRQINANIVLANTARGCRFGWPVARWRGCKLVVHQRDSYGRNAFNALLGRADHIIAISRAARRTLPDRLQARATVIYDPIDVPDEEALGDKATPGWTGRWSNMSIKIGLPGLCDPRKGQDLFLQAAKTVLATRPNSEFHICGMPAQGSDDAYVRGIRAAAQALGERVHLYPFRANIDDFYREMDLIVQPSRVVEAFGRVAAEAMAFATPIVAARHGGLVEVVEESETGWLHAPGDSADLARVLLEVIEHPAEAEARARAGRRRVAARFDPVEHAVRVAAVLSDVASG